MLRVTAVPTVGAIHEDFHNICSGLPSHDHAAWVSVPTFLPILSFWGVPGDNHAGWDKIKCQSCYFHFLIARKFDCFFGYLLTTALVLLRRMFSVSLSTDCQGCFGGYVFVYPRYECCHGRVAGKTYSFFIVFSLMMCCAATLKKYLTVFSIP